MNFRGSISQKEEPSLLFSEESNVFSLPEGQSGYEEAKRLLEASQIDINKLHGRIEELETDLEASNADVSKLKNKYTVKFHEVEATRQNVCELEVQLQAYSTDIELLRKENRILVKESSEMNARLEKEVKNIERLRSEWSSREGNLLEQLRQQRQENKTLRAQTARLEKELELAINSDAAAGNEEIEELKTELKKSEKKAHLASLELTEAQRVVRDLESRLTSELTTSERLREENQELSQLNSSLMEDAENYRQMYEEQNMMLDEMNAGGDLEVNEILRFGERWDEESSKEVEEDAEEEVLEEVEEIDEMAVIGGRLAEELVSDSGRTSPTEVAPERSERSLSIDTTLTSLNPVTGLTFDVEIAHLKHKINGYEDLIDKLLNRIRSEEDDADNLDAEKRAVMRENTRQYASQVLKANGTPNKRFSWFFGTTSKSGSPTKKQSSIDLPGSSAQTSTKRQPPAVDLPISDEMPELVPAINPEPFLTIKTDVISMPLPVASTGIRTPLPRSPTPNSLKFDTLDSVRLSSRLEKVVSRSSSMNFSDVTSSEGTRTPRADMCHSRPVLGGPPLVAPQQAVSSVASPNQPGLIRRLWRTGVSWVGGSAVPSAAEPAGEISKDVEWVGRYEEVRPMRS